MPVNYEKNKEHIYKWRENNKTKYNEYIKKVYSNLSNETKQKNYQRRKELIILRQDLFYVECEKFRNIQIR